MKSKHKYTVDFEVSGPRWDGDNPYVAKASFDYGPTGVPTLCLFDLWRTLTEDFLCSERHNLSDEVIKAMDTAWKAIEKVDIKDWPKS